MNNYLFLFLFGMVVFFGKNKYEVDTANLQKDKDILKNRLNEANNKYEQIYLKYKSNDFDENDYDEKELLCMV